MRNPKPADHPTVRDADEPHVDPYSPTSPGYAERHRVLPVQVTPGEVVVATAEPFVTDWVDEVERQSRRTVRSVTPSASFFGRIWSMSSTSSCTLSRSVAALV